MPRPIQPADETPMVPPDDAAPVLTSRADHATAPPPTGPKEAYGNPEVESVIGEVGSAVARRYDEASTAIDSVIAGVRDSLAHSASRAERVISRVLKGVDDAVGAERQRAADLGVPIVWGPGAVAAELDDPDGRPLIDAITSLAGRTTDEATMPVEGDAPQLPERDYPEAESAPVYVDDDQGAADVPTDGTSPPPPPAVVPRSTGWVPVLQPTPPPPAPPPAPPPPPVYPPFPGPPCASWSPGQPQPFWHVGYSVAPEAGGVPIVVLPPPSDVPAPTGQVMVWTSPTDGRQYAVSLAFVPSVFPPGPWAFVDQMAIPEGVRYAGQLIQGGCQLPPPPPPGQPCPDGTWASDCTSNEKPGTPGAPMPPPTSPPSGECCPTEQLPARVAPVGPATAPGGVDSLNWDSPAACDVLDKAADGAQDDAAGGSGAVDIPDWLSWVKGVGDAAAWSIPGMASGVVKSLTSLGERPGRLAELGTDNAVGASLMQAVRAYVPGDAVPHAAAGLATAAKLGLVNRAEMLLGAPLTYLFQSTQYLYQALNPQYIPAQPAVDQLYLTNRITSGYWECLTRANGNLPTLAGMVRDAQARRPIESEVIQLRLRNEIPTDDEYVRRMRELGVVDRGHALELLTLASWIPGAADLITFMVRDAADDRVAEKYRYDDGFTDKFAGPIKEWARAQGIAPEVFKYNWRAHWKIPSNTQLYSMLHRLRPDRPEVVEWEKQFESEGGNPDWLRANPRPPVVTRDDVAEAIRINDTAPGWVDSLIDVSYHPLTNTDARRAYQIGFFDRDQLKRVMLDNGYNQADAETLTRYFEADRNRSTSTTSGVMSPRVIMNGFREGSITRRQAYDLLEEHYPDPTVRTRQLDRAEIQQVMEIRRASIAAVRKAFVFGEIDEDLARFRLADAGIPAENHTALIARFLAARAGHKKEPRVTLLCQWYTHRLITREQYFERLMRLGYTREDAARISQVCENDAILKAQQAERKLLETMKKEAKGNLATLKQQVAEMEKKKKELEDWLAKNAPAGTGAEGA